MKLHEVLRKMRACNDALTWVADRPATEETWDACPRGDWLLWLLGKLKIDRPRLVLAACECARLALVHVPEGEERPLRAVETAEAWARGGEGVPTLNEVRNAAYAANAAADAADAAYAAYANAAAYAAYAAADAADAAAANAATDAAYAAADAAYAAYAAADAAANAAYAAYAAADAAANAATDAAYAAADAADAAYAADAADAAAYAAAARLETLAKCADIVRRHVSWSEVQERLSARL